MGFDIKDGVLKKYTEENGITEVTIPDGIVNIDNCAFHGCTGITSITIPESVTNIGYSAFYNCTGLAEIKVSPENKNYRDVDGVLFSRDTNEIILYPNNRPKKAYSIPDGVKVVGSFAFSESNNLTSINIPDSVEEIKNGAFCSCKNLAEINIPDSVIKIGEIAFDNTLWLKKYPDNSVIINGLLYKYKRNPENITIPDGVKTIGHWSFNACNRLKSVTIPDSVTKIEHGAFCNCNNLTAINIPDGVTSIGGQAFQFCHSLTSIDIPDGISKIEQRTFQHCTSLTSVNIPDSVTSIEEHAFQECGSLSSITIPDSVKNIGNYAFNKCDSLKIITIPYSMLSICMYAFNCCDNLTTVNVQHDGNIMTFGKDRNSTDLNANINGYEININPIEIQLAEASLEDILSMLRTKHFSIKISPEVKYGLILDYFIVSGDTDAEKYLRHNTGRIMKKFIEKGSSYRIQTFLYKTDFVTEKYIDKLIIFSDVVYNNRLWKNRIYSMLTDYKNKLSL